jgi:hypothetical protein
MGKYLQGLTLNDDIDTWAEQRAWNRKILKAFYPIVGLPE